VAQQRRDALRQLPQLRLGQTNLDESRERVERL